MYHYMTCTVPMTIMHSSANKKTRFYLRDQRISAEAGMETLQRTAAALRFFVHPPAHRQFLHSAASFLALCEGGQHRLTNELQQTPIPFRF